MNKNNTGTIVIDSNKEEIEKLTKKLKKIEKTGKVLFDVGMSGVVITVLSPFDFEGPIAEIITAVTAGAGFVIKTVAKNKLNNLEDSNEDVLNDKDKEDLKETANLISNMIKKAKKTNQNEYTTQEENEQAFARVR